MELRIGNSKMAMIPPDALDSEESWDSALFLGNQFRSLWRASRQQPLSSLAEVFEGERGFRSSGDAESTDAYRASSISAFEINPTPDQWGTSVQFGQGQVQPGDVIVKRVAPVLAAVVPVGLPALPVDGSFFVIRGLTEADAWWIAFCLNHPTCADYLLSKSGRGVLSRVSLSVLRRWTAPETPAGFSALARRLAEVLSKRTFLASRIAALESEVETAVAEQMATTAYEDSEERFARQSWSFFFPAALTDPSWLPLHVANRLSFWVKTDLVAYSWFVEALFEEELSNSAMGLVLDPLAEHWMDDVSGQNALGPVMARWLLLTWPEPRPGHRQQRQGRQGAGHDAGYFRRCPRPRVRCVSARQF